MHWYERLGRGRQAQHVDRGDVSWTVGSVARKLGDDPAGAGEAARQAGRIADRAHLERVGAGGCSRRAGCRLDPRRCCSARLARRRPRSPRRPTLRSSLIRSSTATPSIPPLIVIRTPGPATGSSPAQARRRARSSWSWPTEVSPRESLACSWRQLGLGRRHLGAQLVVAGVEVAHQHGQLGGGQGVEAVAGLLRAELDHDQRPEHERDYRQRKLVPTPSSSAGPTRPARQSCRLIVPA